MANVDAMAAAVADDGPITVERIVGIHQRLLARTDMAIHAGKVRTEQNWIGGNAYSPIGAAFVPPPYEDVSPLLEDLCAFCNRDQLPAVAQAAIAHAQFETIHPFVDGNGRTGRALIHMIFRRRHLVTTTLVPVSLVLAKRASDYVAALMRMRYDGEPNNSNAVDAVNAWVGLFSASCAQAARDAEKFEDVVQELLLKWAARLSHVRRDSNAFAILNLLPETPILNARTVEQALHVHFSTANAAIETLVAAGILTNIKVGRRNRAFEARELIDAFADLERQLTT